MKKRIISGLLSSAVILSEFGGAFASVRASADTAVHEHDVRQLTAVSNISYTESTELTRNPYRGFYQHLQINYSRGYGNVDMQQEYIDTLNDYAKKRDKKDFDLIHLRLDISDFSAHKGVKNKNKDAYINTDTTDLEAALKELFDTLRKNGQSAVVRFAYDLDYEGNSEGRTSVCEPASMDTVTQHQQALGKIMSGYPDVIASVECGIFGKWGEMHSSLIMTDDNLKTVISQWLDVLPDSIPISVRQPEFYSKWRNVKIDKLNTDTSSEGEPAYRVGIYNDGYLGSYDDRGTFRDRDIEVAWLEKQARHTLYGGEIVLWEKSSHAPNCEPKNNVAYMETEAYQTHTSYLNRGWNEEVTDPFRANTYSGSDSVYKNSGVTEFNYLSNRLGYRYVVRGVRLTKTTTNYENFAVEADIENVGFAELVKDKAAVLVIQSADGKDTETYDLSALSTNLKESAENIDVRHWDTAYDLKKAKAQKKDGHYVTTFKANVDLPDRFKAGNYKVYLKLITKDPANKDCSEFPIRFSNKGTNVYNDKLKANYLGDFSIEDDSKITKADVIDGVKFYHSVSAVNDMSVNYYIESENLKSYDNVRLLVTKKKYDKSGKNCTQTEKVISEYSVGNTGDNGKEEYKFTFTGISAYELGDDLTARIVAEKNGSTYYSGTDVYSVKKYAMNMLNASESKAGSDLKKVMVDMLTYGAEAQRYFGYRLDSLMDSDITSAMRSYGSVGTPVLSKYSNIKTTNGATAAISGKSIIASDKTTLKYYMTFNKGQSLSGVSLKLSYTAIDGKPMSITVKSDEFEYNENTGEYSANISTIAAKDFDADVTAGIYDSSRLISDEVHYSISTYISNMLNNSSSSDSLKKVMNALGNFSISTKKYFENHK